MSITFDLILVLIFLIPGFLARKLYFLFPYSKGVSRSNRLIDIGYAIIVAFFIHFFLIIILYGCALDFFRSLESQIVSVFNVNTIYKEGGSLTVEMLQGIRFEPIFLYIIFSWVFSGAIGYVSGKLVRISKFDRRFPVFKYDNEWHYFFSTSRRLKRRKKNLVIYLDVLVETSLGPILYIGTFEEFNLDSSGQLSNIRMKGVKRRFLKDEKQDKGGVNHFSIPSDNIVVPGNRIQNINIRYFVVERNKAL